MEGLRQEGGILPRGHGWRLGLEDRKHQDVIDMFKIRKGVELRRDKDPHSSYRETDLADQGGEVIETPGDGPLAGRLQHGSARPSSPVAEDLSPLPEEPNALSAQGIQKAVDGINAATVAERATPKTMGCK